MFLLGSRTTFRKRDKQGRAGQRGANVMLNYVHRLQIGHLSRGSVGSWSTHHQQQHPFWYRLSTSTKWLCCLLPRHWSYTQSPNQTGAEEIHCLSLWGQTENSPRLLCRLSRTREMPSLWQANVDVHINSNIPSKCNEIIYALTPMVSSKWPQEHTAKPLDKTLSCSFLWQETGFSIWQWHQPVFVCNITAVFPWS